MGPAAWRSWNAGLDALCHSSLCCMLDEVLSMPYGVRLGSKQMACALKRGKVSCRQIAQDSEQHGLVAAQQLVEQGATVLTFTQFLSKLLWL